MHYDDFVLQLELRPGRGFRARVTRSPAGEGSEDVELAHLTTSLIDLAESETGSPHRGRPSGGPSRHLAGDDEAPDPLAGDPRQVGALLFDQLIRGRVRSLFDQSLGALRNQSGRGLRLKLKFDPHVPELARLSELPWELLYREETHDFMALDRTTPLVRYLDVPRPTQPIPLPEQLSILVAISSPRDLPALNLDRELEKLDEIWKHQRGLKTRTLKRPSSASLRAALLEEPCHVLHFMGHGDFDPHSGEGVLFFETEDGLSEAVSGQALATKLKDRRELGLVFLNACNTAASSSQDVSPFGGVASALVLGGLPAVLAMQRPITDKAAIRFSQTFYHRLAAGDPVDTAVTEGRQAIDTGDVSAREWAIPALFVRVHDGTVFASATRKVEPPPAPVVPLPMLSSFVEEEGPKRSGMMVKVVGGAAAIILAGLLGTTLSRVDKANPPDTNQGEIETPPDNHRVNPSGGTSGTEGTQETSTKPPPPKPDSKNETKNEPPVTKPTAPVADPRNLQGQLISVTPQMDGSLRAAVAFTNAGEVPFAVTISTGTSYLSDNQGNRYDIGWANLTDVGGGYQLSVPAGGRTQHIFDFPAPRFGATEFRLSLATISGATIRVTGAGTLD